MQRKEATGNLKSVPFEQRLKLKRQGFKKFHKKQVEEMKEERRVKSI